MENRRQLCYTGPAGSRVEKSNSGIEYASGFEYTAQPGTQNTFEAGDKVNKMTGMFADVDFFTMFSYPLLRGNAGSALSSPSGIAVSGKMAEQFFGSVDKAVGKTIRFEITKTC
ncbi:MAG: ABC transporter permease [Bacteroidota bacterium]